MEKLDVQLKFKKHTNSHSSINLFTLWKYSYQYFNDTESEWERNVAA